MTEYQTTSSDKRIIRSLGLYVVCLSLAIISVILLVATELDLLTQDERLKDIFSNVGVGVLTSSLLAPAFAYFADSSLVNWLGSTVADRFTQALDRVQSDRASHLPSHVFDSQLRFDPRFHEVISSDFAGCQFHGFHGQTARYVAMRLDAVRAPYFKHLCIRVPYPSMPATTEIAISQRLLLKSFSGKTREQILQSLHDDVLMGLVGCLLRVQSRGNITMVVGPISPDLGVRTEVLDTACYVSMYDTARAGQSAQPETIRYPKGSMIHRIFLESDRMFFDRVLAMRGDESARRVVDGRPHFVITKDTRREAWEPLLVEMGFSANAEAILDAEKRFLEWERRTSELLDR